jgi:beta-RFAP synthase
MPGPVSTDIVFVEADARLHFGVLDLGGAGGRWFGGIGASVVDPTVLVEASPADELTVEGADAGRAEQFARCFLDYHAIPGGAAVRVHRSLPVHAGLGSGTQLALAVARALAEIYGVRVGAGDLAQAVGRAGRSAIGTWTFDGGGLVVEGGRRAGTDRCGPLVARMALPQSWRAVVVVPHGARGLSGAEEAAAFARLPKPDPRQAEHVAHLVLMSLLPAVVEADLATFGSALCEIQQATGAWFASVQGDIFAGPSRDMAGRLRDWGAPGVGQSSWGPAIYAIVEGDDEAERLARRARTELGGTGRVYQGPFRATGARLWRTPADDPEPRPASRESARR